MPSLISLVMTVYNREKYLSFGIDSILLQTYPHWHLTIWDDGSTDTSPDIAREYARIDPRIRFISGQHTGRANALRAAVAATDLPYLAFIDSDDLLAPSALAATVKILDTQPNIGMVYTDHAIIDAQGKVQGRGARCQIPYSPERLLIDFMTFHFRLLRREVYDRCGGIDPQFPQAQDYDLCLKISEITEINHLPQILYYYRAHADTISNTQKVAQIERAATAVKNALVRRGLADRYFLEIDREGRFQIRQKDRQSLKPEDDLVEPTIHSLAHVPIQSSQFYTAAELALILDREATQRVKSSDLKTAWSIRQHLWTIAPARVDNILQLILIATDLDLLTTELLTKWRVLEILERINIDNINERYLEIIIAAILSKKRLFTELSLAIIDRCLQLTPPAPRKVLAHKLTSKAFELFHRADGGSFAIKLAQQCQPSLAGDLDALQVLVGLYTKAEIYDRAIANSELYGQLAKTKFEKLFGSYLDRNTYLTSGNWDNYLERQTQHRQLVRDVIDNAHEISQEPQKQHLIVTSNLSFYTSDSPQIDRPLQNQIAKIYRDHLPQFTTAAVKGATLAKRPDIIRIGYLASTLKQHSVGWLSRWVFHHHNRQSFQIFTYCLNQSAEDPFNHQWFRDKVDVAYYFRSPQEVISQIRADEIDILIDLDSLAFDLSCRVMAAKPAPVQATWLGFDASGIPAIDYFIVDPYVLPECAQDYYQERLWRLPTTYLAVDGFEVGAANISRQSLDIPDDAIVYLSTQAGFKRHPDNIRCQMKIIAAVPNSYLLIKGKSDPTIIRNLFGKIAAQSGVRMERLRFLPHAPTEYIHRANLAIADIVLDTFPYNGATTTLETLWMGIPLVTQVGKQFAARNSYTFMLNAGIEAGIAWSEAEYIEWGIKLGLEPQLRREISKQLHVGRKTAPVWNAQQFTLDLEQAYQAMWVKYQAESKSKPLDICSNP